ncbi:TetR/AcrR family transcriptional regulator [Brevibacterium sediminis]|uniref:TetR family transcriptional regulator n=1 Tax=Brevibacterium sediminis TaxID=1857024 RepID=A0ABQ1MPA9_9MICO|nr:TetR/AcrR family transcriptional regulator [Brevibacterium sediminis]GGC44132.1 TetR family transcriptional regulator [Brevibacterium sediminis]
MTTPSSLRARSQSRIRQAIIDAAYDLFAECDFDAVSVSEIAERAAVGRTTFFRYFGDKQEVLFADEGQVAELLVAEASRVGTSPTSTPFHRARCALRAVSVHLVAGGERFALRSRLVAENQSLRDREERKLLWLSGVLAEALKECGATTQEARLSTEIAFGVFRAARYHGSIDSIDLVRRVDDSFEQTIRMFDP